MSVMPFGPGAMGTLMVNDPSTAALPATFTRLSALCASSALRACVFPVMVATGPLTVASLAGEVTVMAGGVWSST